MEILIGLIGVVIAWLTYQKTFNSKPDISEEKNNLLATYKATQKLHLEIQTLIQNYIDKNDGANHELYPNITFQSYLNVAKDEYERSLSDKLYDDLRNNENFTKSNIESLQKDIDTQSKALSTF